MADLEHWQMWRERCALDLCDPGVRHDLRGFAYNRYQQYLRKCGAGDTTPPPAGQAWHWFETYLAIGRRRSSKAYKEWLFARGQGETTLDMVQGGATLLMRDVVREQLRRESSPGWMRSLDAPASPANMDGETGPSLAELLPESHDALTDIERRELGEIARANAKAAFDALSRRERIAIASFRAGLSLAHPAVVSAGECGKSSLFNALGTGMRKMADIVRMNYPKETPSAQASIAILLLEQVHTGIFEWLRLEESLNQLFGLMGQDEGEVG